MTDFFGSANKVRAPVLFLLSTVKEDLFNLWVVEKVQRKGKEVIRILVLHILLRYHNWLTGEKVQKFHDQKLRMTGIRERIHLSVLAQLEQRTESESNQLVRSVSWRLKLDKFRLAIREAMYYWNNSLRVVAGLSLRQAWVAFYNSNVSCGFGCSKAWLRFCCLHYASSL